MEDRTRTSLIALRRILGATEASSRALAKRTGLTTPQLIVLKVVEEKGEATAKTIAQRARVAQATATALIDRLVQRGYVVRRRGESDRRQVWVSLTEAGKAALAAAPDPLHERFSSRFEALADWEQAMVVAGLERVAALLDVETVDASPVLHVGDLKAGAAQASPEPPPRVGVAAAGRPVANSATTPAAGGVTRAAQKVK
ncbi:MarR family winged helix-turn-helix transcriptional regulator [Roseospirillum parvum]|uniref:DNA-binding transcriptional regulator, MarR family n=1 Tax=Roseospirillum parvum TaxID=83401 RepID=A0A1G7WWC9_9PROT|nr:MarR family transcriptional regulator [Roseospirillum parvum]SDG76189.1 DNA-binding transcriptional regulator, MarR family [Roseospirillum parvum]